MSIVIPTTGDGKPLLQECLVRLSGICDPEETELIVIDNASIDDTFDYLQQLRTEGLLNIRIITNRQNNGFGPSVNQGIRESRGTYVLVMHNDLFPDDGCLKEMIRIMEQYPDIGVLGPVLDRCDHPDQTAGQLETTDGEILKVNRLDSSCMLLRASASILFDDALSPAFYDDMDLCNQMAEKGFYVAIALRASASHLHRRTTEAMGLYLEPELEWKNTGIYLNKWEGMDLSEAPEPGNPVDTLVNMEIPVNPLNPPAAWLEQVEDLLSNETKTEISRNEWGDEFLFRLVAILLIADQREFLRKMEDRLDNLELPVPLLKSLIRFYYKKNIFSRCRHYLKKAGKRDPFFNLYRLRIAVSEKESETAAAFLTPLMEQFPCHPELYKMAGDIHRMNGNEGEAKSFYALAGQLNPGHILINDEAFEIRF